MDEGRKSLRLRRCACVFAPASFASLRLRLCADLVFSPSHDPLASGADWDEPDVPTARLRQVQPPPAALDIDNDDVAGEPRYKVRREACALSPPSFSLPALFNTFQLTLTCYTCPPRLVPFWNSRGATGPALASHGAG